MLRDVGLLDDLYAAGAKVAALMVELFADVAPDSDAVRAVQLHQPRRSARIPDAGVEVQQGQARGHLRARQGAAARAHVPARQIAPPPRRHGRQRCRRRIVAARDEFSRRYAGRDDICEFFQPDRFSAALSIQDNILFGRVAFDQANAQARISALVRDIATEEGLNEDLVRLGLEFDVGNGGSRLSYSERQRLAIARGLMKNPDILVFNEPTSGLDPATEAARAARGTRMGEGADGALVAVAAELAREFDRVLVLAEGQLVEEGSFDELERGGKALANLVA